MATRALHISSQQAPRICAVVVTYNPSPSFIDNITALRTQVDHVVVVDNGSRSETGIYLAHLESMPRCTVVRNHRNLGIAAGLNIGVTYAKDAGFDWVATFDQDSRVGDSFISHMLETFRQTPDPEKIAIVAPSYVDRDSGKRGELVLAANGGLLTTWTSGSMMPINAINGIGAFDESLYIDCVDTDFCLRARRKGMLILRSPAVLFHSVGRTTYHRMFGRSFLVTNHSPGRRYYITRNRLRLVGRYRMGWGWTCREMREILVETAAVFLVEDLKWQKLKAIVHGAFDALRGKSGKQVDL